MRLFFGLSGLLYVTFTRLANRLQPLLKRLRVRMDFVKLEPSRGDWNRFWHFPVLCQERRHSFKDCLSWRFWSSASFTGHSIQCLQFFSWRFSFKHCRDVRPCEFRIQDAWVVFTTNQDIQRFKFLCEVCESVSWNPEFLFDVVALETFKFKKMIEKFDDRNSFNGVPCCCHFFFFRNFFQSFENLSEVENNKEWNDRLQRKKIVCLNNLHDCFDGLIRICENQGHEKRQCTKKDENWNLCKGRIFETIKKLVPYNWFYGPACHFWCAVDVFISFRGEYMVFHK